MSIDLSKLKTTKIIDNWLSSLLTHYQWLLWIIFLFSVFTLAFIIYRKWFNQTPNIKNIHQYTEDVNQLKDDSKRKSQIITLIDQVNKEIPILNSLSIPYRLEYGKKLISMLIEGIPQLFKKPNSTSHRVALFVPDEKDLHKLKIFIGCGYSVQGEEKLKLSIGGHGSTAGYVYLCGDVKYVQDVTKDSTFVPHPKATKKYRSLLCVPITIREETVAVLSIDGAEVDCFSNDDIQYFKMFSNLMGILMDQSGFKISKGDGDLEKKVTRRSQKRLSSRENIHF